MKRQQITVFGTGEIAKLADFYFKHDSELEVAGFTVDAAFPDKNEFLGRPVAAFEDVQDRFPPDRFGIFVARQLRQGQRNSRRESRGSA